MHINGFIHLIKKYELFDTFISTQTIERILDAFTQENKIKPNKKYGFLKWNILEFEETLYLNTAMEIRLPNYQCPIKIIRYSKTRINRYSTLLNAIDIYREQKNKLYFFNKPQNEITQEINTLLIQNKKNIRPRQCINLLRLLSTKYTDLTKCGKLKTSNLVKEYMTFIINFLIEAYKLNMNTIRKRFKGSRNESVHWEYINKIMYSPQEIDRIFPDYDKEIKTTLLLEFEDESLTWKLNKTFTKIIENSFNDYYPVYYYIYKLHLIWNSLDTHWYFDMHAYWQKICLMIEALFVKEFQNPVKGAYDVISSILDIKYNINYDRLKSSHSVDSFLKSSTYIDFLYSYSKLEEIDDELIYFFKYNLFRNFFAHNDTLSHDNSLIENNKLRDFSSVPMRIIAEIYDLSHP